MITHPWLEKVYEHFSSPLVVHWPTTRTGGTSRRPSHHCEKNTDSHQEEGGPAKFFAARQARHNIFRHGSSNVLFHAVSMCILFYDLIQLKKHWVADFVAIFWLDSPQPQIEGFHAIHFPGICLQTPGVKVTRATGLEFSLSSGNFRRREYGKGMFIHVQ